MEFESDISECSFLHPPTLGALHNVLHPPALFPLLLICITDPVFMMGVSKAERQKKRRKGEFIKLLLPRFKSWLLLAV